MSAGQLPDADAFITVLAADNLELLHPRSHPFSLAPMAVATTERKGQWSGLRWRDKNELPPGVLAIGSPYDTQARYGIKRGVGWRGYKAHFTETCSPDRPT